MKRKNRILSLCTTLIMLTLLAGLFSASPVVGAKSAPKSNQSNGKTAAAGQGIQIYIDGVKLDLSGNYPFVENGVVYVPGKEVFKALGTVLNESWNDGRRIFGGVKPRANGSYANFYLAIGSCGSAGNQQIKSAAAARYVNNEYFVPVSFADAAMEVKTTYNKSQNRLDISTGRNSADMNLQKGSEFNAAVFKRKTTREIQDNRIRFQLSTLCMGTTDRGNLVWMSLDSGQKRASVTINNQDWEPENWNVSEMAVSKADDDFYTQLHNNGIILTYNLIFKDKDFQRQGGKLKYPRFEDEAEIQRYLDFVRFTVRHFKGRVKYYDVWNEPNINMTGFEEQYIKPEDYIKVAKRVVPIVREEDPDAKIIVGSAGGYSDASSQEYTSKIITSDLMPLADAVAIHAPFWESPEYRSDFYYNYPQLLEDIKQTARSHGFKGEFTASEGNMGTSTNIPSDMVGRAPEYSYLKSAKYVSRYIITNLALDFAAGSCACNGNDSYSYAVIGNLCTLMAGAKPATVNTEILSAADKTRSYAFSLPNGERLVAVWNDGAAKDNNISTVSAIKISQTGKFKVTAIDVLNSFEQDIAAKNDGGNIVIENFNLKDYPVFFRLRTIQ